MKNIFWIILLATATCFAGETKSKIVINAILFNVVNRVTTETTTVMELKESTSANGLPMTNWVDGSAEARLKFSPNCEYVVTIKLSNFVGTKETKNPDYNMDLRTTIEPINKRLLGEDRIKLCGTYDYFGIVNFGIDQHRLTPISFDLPFFRNFQKPRTVIDGEDVSSSKFEVRFGQPTAP